MGLSGYYRRFIPRYSSISTPLTDLTKKSLPFKVQWTRQCEEAFIKLKQCLCTAPVLTNPDFEKTFFLQTDASNVGISAILSQKDSEGQDHPIAYYSRKLLPRETRYSTVEKECLAVKIGVQAFKVYLLGKPFVIETDHRALVWLDRLKDSNSRLARWSLALQPFKFEVTHRPGSQNGNADGLLRAAED